jgi:3-methyladenine DNA glycosylase AlkD
MAVAVVAVAPAGAHTVDAVMAELERLGTAQTVKTLRRHGVGANVFGVSYADLGKLKKRLKTNHELALGLWATGNHDARVLATMIVDPARLTDAELDRWRDAVDCYALTGHVSEVAAGKAGAPERAARWIGHDGEWAARAGWQLIARLALDDAALPGGYFAALLPVIEAGIHGSKNWVRDAMNDALIAIGGRSEALREQATAAARRIGKVHVDQGDTACKTPDAAGYIDRIWARRLAKAGQGAR